MDDIPSTHCNIVSDKEGAISEILDAGRQLGGTPQQDLKRYAGTRLIFFIAESIPRVYNEAAFLPCNNTTDSFAYEM